MGASDIADFAKLGTDIAVGLVVLVAIILPQVDDAKTADADHATLYGSIIVFFILALLIFTINATRGRYAK